MVAVPDGAVALVLLAVLRDLDVFLADEDRVAQAVADRGEAQPRSPLAHDVGRAGGVGVVGDGECPRAFLRVEDAVGRVIAGRASVIAHGAGIVWLAPRPGVVR